MNENEILSSETELSEKKKSAKNEAEPVIAESGDAAPAEEAEKAEELSCDTEAEEEVDGGEEVAEEETVPLSDEARRRAVCDPMFPTFAKGKDQPLDELISDFIKMTSLGEGELRLSPMTLATPSGAAASPDYALSERQRKIAQSAGMSYREYYNFLKTMK